MGLTLRAGRALAIALVLAASLGLAPAWVRTSSAAEEPGGLAVTTVDVAGTILVGTCFELWTDAGGGTAGRLVASARCDQPGSRTSNDGTADGTADGVTAWTGLAPGPYVLRETLPPALAETTAIYAPAPDMKVTIPAGEVSRLDLAHRLVGGLTLRTTDAAGRPLAGACFSVTTTGRTPTTTVLCDGAVPTGTTMPADGRADGLLLFVGLTPSLRPTDYTLHELFAPAGYAVAADQAFAADPARPTELTIEQTTGGGAGLAVTTVDAAGATLVQACLELWTIATGNSLGARLGETARCDSLAQRPGRGEGDGIADGTIGWAGLSPGRYFLVETLSPFVAGTSGRYELLDVRPIELNQDVVTRLELAHRPIGGLVLRTTDPLGNALVGACYALRDTSGQLPTTVARCDGVASPGGPAGDGDGDGVIVFGGLTPASTATTYELSEVVAPPGYEPSPARPVTIDPFAAAELTVINTTGTGGSLVVRTVDIAGTSLVGTCFELWTADSGGSATTPIAGSARCDQPGTRETRRGTPDGIVDGSTAWTSVAPGSYVIRETLPPALAGTAATYELLGDTPATVTRAAVTTETLVHRPTGALVLRKTDAAGRPLEGACFAVSNSRDRTLPAIAICDGEVPSGTSPRGDGKADGLLLFVGLTPASRPETYTLRELRAPSGYAAVADQTIAADPATPTELTIANATGGGPTGGQVVALELEISSRIQIDSLNTYAVANGVATATGRLRLEGSPGSDSWTGAGTLASVTTSGTAACPSTAISGEGTYDWVVRGAHAGPDVPIAELTVDMDSGPANESPDEYAIDACIGELLTGTMNTWENLFFDAYRSRFVENGFRVQGWKLVDAGAWTTGGLVAEATWTAKCATELLLGCQDETTFRLYAVVDASRPVPTSSAGPGGPTGTEGPAGSGDPGAPTASPAPSAGIGPGGPAVECGLDCGGFPVLPIVIGGGVVILGAGFVFLRFFGTNQVVKLEGPALNATGGSDPAMEPLDLDKLATTDGFEKLTTTFSKVEPLEVDLSKVEPTDPILEKLEPLDTTFEKLEPLDVDLSKVEPIDTDLSKVEPLDPNLSKVEPLPDGTLKLDGSPEAFDPSIGGELPPAPQP